MTQKGFLGDFLPLHLTSPAAADPSSVQVCAGGWRRHQPSLAGFPVCGLEANLLKLQCLLYLRK